ncbi:uncharacterized protein EV422DRAFT_509929 [Fimicolochytrium jonesii]|uniref:uncharacterized protein n=1 Tax=Fimicolochytrium jonesii TaxID=1396493 RepID=UPI0022FEB8D5|nr:uncharacterized protein EV422DRAFT_509929 [Fimicolochytrium jonesii]KAI8816354.1 hypothetical protein EV422DRAFT_509929 [Fimicolochytrium jonesii]
MRWMAPPSPSPEVHSSAEGVQKIPDFGDLRPHQVHPSLNNKDVLARLKAAKTRCGKQQQLGTGLEACLREMKDEIARSVAMSRIAGRSAHLMADIYFGAVKMARDSEDFNVFSVSTFVTENGENRIRTLSRTYTNRATEKAIHRAFKMTLEYATRDGFSITDAYQSLRFNQDFSSITVEIAIPQYAGICQALAETFGIDSRTAFDQFVTGCDYHFVSRMHIIAIKALEGYKGFDRDTVKESLFQKFKSLKDLAVDVNGTYDQIWTNAAENYPVIVKKAAWWKQEDIRQMSCPAYSKMNSEVCANCFSTTNGEESSHHQEETSTLLRMSVLGIGKKIKSICIVGTVPKKHGITRTASGGKNVRLTGKSQLTWEDQEVETLASAPTASTAATTPSIPSFPSIPMATHSKGLWKNTKAIIGFSKLERALTNALLAGQTLHKQSTKIKFRLNWRESLVTVIDLSENPIAINQVEVDVQPTSQQTVGDLEEELVTMSDSEFDSALQARSPAPPRPQCKAKARTLEDSLQVVNARIKFLEDRNAGKLPLSAEQLAAHGESVKAYEDLLATPGGKALIVKKKIPRPTLRKPIIPGELLYSMYGHYDLDMQLAAKARLMAQIAAQSKESVQIISRI